MRGVRSGPAYLVLGIAAWVAFFKSGVDPIVVGLVVGLMSYAYPATRASLEQASEAFRMFREQPTAELAQSARDVVRMAISPNDRLAQLFHPWSSYLIVPLFALANAGIVLNAGLPGPGLHLAGHARHRDRLPGRQAGRHGGLRVAGDQAQPRAAAAAGRMGRGGGRGRGGRDRLHRVAADRLARAAAGPSWPRRSSAS